MLLAIEAEDDMLPVSEFAKAAAAFELAGGGWPPPPPPRPPSADILPKTSW